ncbi:MAG TPA: porin [Longimicrobium sp.]|nr:porin [Longimicrobium sp.]
MKPSSLPAALLLAVLALAATVRPAAADTGRTVLADTFKLKLSGRVQTLYQHSAPDGDADAKLYGGATGTRPQAQATSLMRIRRGRLVMEGFAYDPRLEYNVQLELAGQSVSLKRAFVNWRLHGADAQLRAGKFKVPFGRQQLTSSFQQQLADRSLVSDEFAKGDDDGVMVWGLPAGGRLEYYAGVFNGEGNNRNSQQDGFNQLAARVAVSPLGAVPYAGPALEGSPRLTFSIGVNGNLNGGWLHEVNGAAGLQPPSRTCTAEGCTVDEGDDARIVHLGADAAVRWRGVSASAELFGRTVDPRQAGLGRREARGWYAQAGAFVIPARLEGGVRVGRLDPDADRTMDRVREVTPFANAYVHGHDLKVQVDYTLLSTEVADARAGGTRGTRLDEGRLRVQLQFQCQPPR